ncbi:hypothetical protein quinque_013870 [Culex quinquefasciatus]
MLTLVPDEVTPRIGKGHGNWCGRRRSKLLGTGAGMEGNGPVDQVRLVVAVDVPTHGLMLLQPSLDPRLPALCASSSLSTDSSFSSPLRYRWSCPVSGAGLVDVGQVFGCGSWFPDGGLTRLSFERLVTGRHRLCTVDGLGIPLASHGLFRKIRVADSGFCS